MQKQVVKLLKILNPKSPVSLKCLAQHFILTVPSIWCEMRLFVVHMCIEINNTDASFSWNCHQTHLVSTSNIFLLNHRYQECLMCIARELYKYWLSTQTKKQSLAPLLQTSHITLWELYLWFNILPLCDFTNICVIINCMVHVLNICILCKELYVQQTLYAHAT